MILMLLLTIIWINPSTQFSTTGLFLYPLKTSENPWFFNDFRGYRKRTMTWNRLTTNVPTNALQTNRLISFWRKHWLLMGQWNDVKCKHFRLKAIEMYNIYQKDLCFATFQQLFIWYGCSNVINIGISRESTPQKDVLGCKFSITTAVQSQPQGTSELYN